MRNAAWWIASALIWVLMLQSCSDPEKPNSCPVIVEYSPEDIFLEAAVLFDSITFNLAASDPDGDKVTYSYVIIGHEGEVLEVMAREPDYTFRPTDAGYYHLRGRAHDHSCYAARDWFVNVTRQDNDPPVIEWYFPEQDSIAALIGSTIEFRLCVDDDHPEYLRYTYYAGSEPIKILGQMPSVQHRFTENGFMGVTGTVWDGEFEDTHSWIVRVTGEPDTIAPARITDLVGWTGPDQGTVRLRWTAPGDNDMEGKACRYLIRTHGTLIRDENDWNEASHGISASVPGQPGTTEEMTAGSLDPGAWRYFMARAVDEFGNISQLGHSSDLGHLMVGGTAPIVDEPSEDEINLIRALYGLPVIIDAIWFEDE